MTASSKGRNDIFRPAAFFTTTGLALATIAFSTGGFAAVAAGWSGVEFITAIMMTPY
jgi:hypothetical protein